MIAAQRPGYTIPAGEWGFITAHSERLEALQRVPQNIRAMLAAHLDCYADDRVVGGTISASLTDSGRMLVSAAEDYADAAQKELDRISPEERAETWKTVKRLRRLEERTGTKQGATR